jgi:predicted nucleic acid-binding protein
VSVVSASAYDGSAGTLVDTNIWLDCIDASCQWHGWAVEQLQRCSERSALHINLIIYAELLGPGSEAKTLDALLDVYDVQRSNLPWACAALAAGAFHLYKHRGGARSRPLPDFFIGAHAAVANLGVLTRDRSGYASYFPRLRLVCPLA